MNIETLIRLSNIQDDIFLGNNDMAFSELGKILNEHHLILSKKTRNKESLTFKKGDLLTYAGGSKTKYLIIGKKYRTTWNNSNSSERVAVIGEDNKRIVMHLSYFK